MDTALTICSMFASYYVLTGIANLAEKMADAATKAVALKSRTLVEGSFCATALFKLIISIFKIQNGSTISTILAVIALLLDGFLHPVPAGPVEGQEDAGQLRYG